MQLTQNIHVATDFSTASLLAVQAGSLLARQHGARVTLVHVLAIPELEEGRVEQSSEYPRKLEVAVHEHLDNIRTESLADVKDVKTAMLRGTNPAASLCNFAKEDDADMLVIATHGRSGLSRFLIGSVAEKVVRHAPCPVLVLRSKNKD